MTARKNFWTALALAAAAGLASAQGYPSTKPIRLIVGYPPGGGIDFAARTVQVPMQEALKQQMVVDYKPGASGMIAATELTRQAPDGYTLLLANRSVRHRALPAVQAALRPGEAVHLHRPDQPGLGPVHTVSGDRVG